VHIDPDVYVPRWLSEPLARRAIERLPATGTAIDVCTGSGAIAAVLRAHRPHARVLASDVDAKAVACAITNDVDAYLGDLFTPLPDDLLSSVDVVVGVAPYVPTPELPLLQRDTFTFERPLSYDGGPDGTNILRRVIRDAPRLLRPGGALLLELGGDQPRLLTVELTDLGYVDVTMLTDEDGDARGLEATMGPS
jgi:release factor glutamine methyltransferase